MNQAMFDFGDYTPAPEFTMAVNEQPPQRFENFGAKAVSDTELLALILQGQGTRPEKAVTLATQLIAEAGSLRALLSWGVPEYRRLKGIGRIKALQLCAVTEIARRMMLSPPGAAPLLNRADLIAAYFRPLIQGLIVEKFFVALLNRKSRLIKHVELTSGTATATLASPREIFRAALREGATAPVTALVCVHNHPSGGSSEPSAADNHVTRLIHQASKTVDIDFLDHVIVVADPAADPNGKGYFSYREAGLL